MKRTLPYFLRAFALAVCLGAFGMGQSQTIVTVNVVQPPALMAIAGQDTGHCPNDSVMIGGMPAGMGGDGNYTYSWSPVTGLSNANVANPNASVTASTDYLLTVIDGNGCTTIDTVNVTEIVCVGIEGSIPGVEITVRPNPTDGAFWLDIRSDHGSEALQIVIYDPLGKKTHEATLEAGQLQYQEQFDLSGEAAGIYFLEVTSQRHRAVHKLIKR